MNEVITQLIAASIDADKIPALDCFDISMRHQGFFRVILNDGTSIKITVEIEEP